DIDRIRETAQDGTPRPNAVCEMLTAQSIPTMRIAVAYDEAFNFYYGELTAVLRSLGAEVVHFSPIHDRLPDADGYIFGGGYPELFLKELEHNDAMREAVRETAENNVPIYAECGGLMYLTRSLTLEAGWQGRDDRISCEMCGVFAGDTCMPVRKALGYVIGTASLPSGDFAFRGHEFHYSGISMDAGVHYAYRLSRGTGIQNGCDGALVHQTLGAYTHLMPVSSRSMLKSFFGL
ncbi:MAG TPA: Ni-sirohydrochlorin a,c-diamide synthase, partial [Methanocorpusculum sp.]|nr:Ni-sirohydrochlorin a,c-diamide synthase [Methanocorpusculum sp.]